MGSFGAAPRLPLGSRKMKRSDAKAEVHPKLEAKQQAVRDAENLRKKRKNTCFHGETSAF